jgi:DNA modification methylase
MITIGNVTVHHGNCLDILPTLPDCSVDSVVTDPPYELGFMGKDWDNSGIAYRVNLWSEVLRVLKPGGHLLAFGATRTYHRMAVAIEDAGFEIRDSIHWIYGSGFPKSLDVSKAIDKVNGEPDRLLKFTAWFRGAGMSVKQVTGILRDAQLISENGTMASHYFAKSTAGQPAIPTAAMWQVLRPHCGEVPEWVDALVARIEAEREIIGKRDVPVGHSFAGPTYGGDSAAVEVDITAPATDAAKQWEGWGTALKPAVEPVVVARRPLIGTVAANVLQYGTGALNIDGTRIGTTGRAIKLAQKGTGSHGGEGFGADGVIARVSDYDWAGVGMSEPSSGRWPANVIFDPDAATELDRQQDGASRFFYIAKPSKAERNAGLDGLPERRHKSYEGGPIASKNGSPGGSSVTTNPHPTVKPLTLMRYLVRLVTPPGGTVLEPFAGSGTTLMAATMEGFNSIGIEMTDDYLPIIEGRVRWAQTQQQELPL